MPPKVDISDATIEQLVKDHLVKNSEDGAVKRHVKKHGGSYTKLTAAIGALTVALNGYTNLAEGTREIAEQNRAGFQALASKVNSMAERMAYIEGRMEGDTAEEAAHAAPLLLKELGQPEPIMLKDLDEGAVNDILIEDTRLQLKSLQRMLGETNDPAKQEALIAKINELRHAKSEPVAFLGVTEVTTASDEVDVKKRAPLKVGAYDQLPENLDKLMQLEQRPAN